MKHITALLLFILSATITSAQWYAYQPALNNARNHNYKPLLTQLDSIDRAFPDSVVVPMTLSLIGSELYEQKAYDMLEQWAHHMIAFDAKARGTRFPVTNDKKWDWVRQEQTALLKRDGNFYLATALFQGQCYDSCLVVLNRPLNLYNYAAIHNFEASVQYGMQIDYMRSVCLEQTGKIDDARKALLPYLFLESFGSENEDYVRQTAIVERYVELLAKSPAKDTVETEFLPMQLTIEGFSKNTCLAMPKGWYDYNPTQTIYNVRIEGAYVPVLIPLSYMDEHRFPKSTLPEKEQPRILPSHQYEQPQLDPAYMEYVRSYLKTTLLYRELK